MESSNIFPTFLQVNASLLNRRGTPAIAISSTSETKNSGEQAESARKFEETVDERQRWLEPQVRIAASLPLMSPPRLLEWVEEEYSSMPHGETGESSVDLIPFQVLSWKPRSLYFPHFATAEQCQSIIEMARSSLIPSTLALRKGETEESTNGIRTSSGTFISASEDKTGILDFIERKIAKATMIPRNHGEVFDILRYEIGQRYNSHYDAINPVEYGLQTSQRIASFLLYLSDVEEGGETMFPFEYDLNINTFNSRKCIGLKVKPRRGDGLLFYSVFPNGTIDWTSMHGSCPVIEGEKWVATKWIRDEQEED